MSKPAAAAVALGPEALLDEPTKFSLFAALRLVELNAKGAWRLGESRSVVDDRVRLRQDASLRFAPGEVTGVESACPLHIHTEGFGLLGPNGPLPLHWTEYASNRARQEQDPTFRDFLNMFHHRFASLFYRAWAGAEPTVEADRFATYVGALIGIACPSLRARDAVDDDAKLYRASRFAGPRSQAGLEDVLQDYFRLPVRIEPFQGEWLRIPTDQLTRLGRANSVGRLGVDANAGRRSWQCQFNFRIVVLHLTYEQLESFLPGGRAGRQLRDIVTLYVGNHVRWTLELRLRRAETPPLRLSKKLRLGWSTWLGERPVHEASLSIRDVAWFSEQSRAMRCSVGE